MEPKEHEPDTCTCRGRKVSDNLHECRSDLTDYCRHRFSFGFGNYCSLLLKDRTDRTDRKTP